MTRTKEKKVKARYGDQMVPRSFANLATQIYRFKRTTTLPTLIQQSATAEVDGAYAYSLSSVPDASDFTALFDQYRISSVRVTFRPITTFNNFLAGNSALPPQLYTAIDYNDGTLVSIADLQQYQSCKVTRFDQNQVRTFSPMIQLAANASGSAVLSVADSSRWIDTAQTSVFYYGLKYGISAGDGSQTVLQRWEVTVEYFLEFRIVQ